MKSYSLTQGLGCKQNLFLFKEHQFERKTKGKNGAFIVGFTVALAKLSRRAK